MAGNFLKYGASEATFGSKNAGDIPVDAHQLIALCAPRPTFISYGVPEKGDAKWLDQQGSFMAAIGGAAGLPPARRQGSRPLRRLHDREDAAGEHADRRPAGVAAARRRPHRSAQLEALHPVGRQDARAHGAPPPRRGGPSARALTRPLTRPPVSWRWRSQASLLVAQRLHRRDAGGAARRDRRGEQPDRRSGRTPRAPASADRRA